MKFDLLSLYPLNQMFDPIKSCLIRHAGRHETVMLDLTVEFGAFLTHSNSVSRVLASNVGCPVR
jgi:hypothetical protein